MMITSHPCRLVNVLLSKKKGGLERAFVNVTNSLVDIGHSVEAWIPADAPYRIELNDRVKVLSFSARGFYDIKAMLSARRMLKNAKPDLIITHNSRATSLMAKSRIGMSCPLLGFSHSDKLKRMRGADNLVVLTESMRQRSLNCGFKDEHVFIFPNMIFDIPPLVDAEPDLEAALPVKLGFVGRINPEKGLDLLLEALAMLIQKGFSLQLHIAGSGDSEVEIRQLAQALNIGDFVVFDGWIDDIACWMQGIDLAVFPSRYEAFGIVVLEAAAYGCPVVSTTADGPASQITDGEDGWLADLDSAVSLADTIEKAISQRKSWPIIIANAHRRALQYSNKSLLPALERIIRSAVSSI